MFRKALEEFAEKYRTEINRDPAFRHQFIRMAKSIGVDPLASSKGFWADTLGVGSFYFDLAVQVIDVCISTRQLNGGLIAMSDLLARLHRMRGSRAASSPVSEDDVRRAIKKLSVLGGGYSVVTVGGQRYVLSVPGEMSQDTTAILQAAATSGKGFVTIASLQSQLGWNASRCNRALESLIKEGMAWIDDQAWRDDPAAVAAASSGSSSSSAAAAAGAGGSGAQAAKPVGHFPNSLHHGAGSGPGRPSGASGTSSSSFTTDDINDLRSKRAPPSPVVQGLMRYYFPSVMALGSAAPQSSSTISNTGAGAAGSSSSTYAAAGGAGNGGRGADALGPSTTADDDI